MITLKFGWYYFPVLLLGNQNGNSQRVALLAIDVLSKTHKIPNFSHFPSDQRVLYFQYLMFLDSVQYRIQPLFNQENVNFDWIIKTKWKTKKRKSIMKKRRCNFLCGRNFQFHVFVLNKRDSQVSFDI